MAKRSLDMLRPLTRCPLAASFQDPVSHCEVCGRNVLDLSACTREQAAELLSVAEPPCVRFVLRDGKPVFREVLRTAMVAATSWGPRSRQYGQSWRSPRWCGNSRRRPPL